MKHYVARIQQHAQQTGEKYDLGKAGQALNLFRHKQNLPTFV